MVREDVRNDREIAGNRHRSYRRWKQRSCCGGPVWSDLLGVAGLSQL